MKYRTFVLPALAAITALVGLEARADNMVSLAIAPATGAVTLVPRWAIGGSLAGFHHMAQDLSLGGGANQFYSIKGTPIPAGGDITAFTRYIAGTGAATNHADIGSKLTPNSYSALTSADPDIGFGPVNFYFIHHKTDGDYFTVIKPSSGVASAVTDLKPMSQPGGPATGGLSGYFGLTFAAANLGDGANIFYYLRRDPVSGFTKYGILPPGLAGASADKFDLGVGGHNALVFSGADVGFGIDKMYFMRLDPVTGFSILGTLNPVTGKAADIANLGSVYSTLAFVPGDVGFGAGRFYATGAVNATWQSVSFAAIADRAISAGSFTVAPSASSALPLVLTVVPGSTGAASISGPVGGVFTITPTAPGIITLQATQAGQAAPTAYEFNMLRQSFTATGAALLAITAQPSPQTVAAGGTANFSVSANGSTALSYQWRKDGTNITGNASATTATLTIPNVQAANSGSYYVLVTNASGSVPSDSATLTVTGGAPIVTNSPLSAAGTAGTAFSFTIAASGSPTSYSASPLPAGLVVNTTTGAITGTPTTAGTTNVLLGATNGSGTGNATLVVTVAAAGVAPVITNSPLNAAGTVGTAFSFTITASGSPTSYSASPLPAGLAINTATGAITGNPSAVGTTSVLLGATNSTGTGNATLTVTVAAAGVAPIITNSPLSAGGTAGTPFGFTITASGSPTSYSASPLPSGLAINTTTGAITGTPSVAGTTSVLLGATNSTGTGNATLTVTVAAAGVAPSITNSPLNAAGTVGTPFGFTITASGSPTSYTASPLPAGLSIVAATGAITGTPTAVGTTSVLLGATNGTGTGNATLTITVAAAGVAPVISNNPLNAAGTVGTPFGFTITASGSPTSYSASPLPAGLSIVAATGAITGTPSAVGTTAVLLGATNSSGTGSATLTITVAGAGSSPIITNNQPNAAATVGAPFGYTIAASGSPTSYSASGLPPGLTLDTLTGVISGTPSGAGVYIATLGANNASGTGIITLVITVAPTTTAPVITSPTTAPGTVGQPFVTYLIAATGLPTSYSATGLPPGLTLNPLTGAITGSPTVAGTSNVTLTATNSAGSTTASLAITVAAAAVAPIITSPTTAPGTVGTPFVTYLIGATGLPTSYTATGLPAGLTLNSQTGAINGTPTTAGTSVVTIQATNSTGTSTATVTITVGAAAVVPTITSPTTAAGTAGAAFNTYLIAATGQPTSYTASGLPAGLTLNSTTGAITGTPTVSGTFVVTLGATNSTGTTTSVVTLVIAPSSRIVNFSARALSGPGNETLIMGFVVSGDNKNLLVRGIGPGLAPHGVVNVLADPLLTLFGPGAAVLATNDDWQTTAAGQANGTVVAATAARVGAFALPNGSKDSAMLSVFSNGAHTTSMLRPNSTAGVALTEIYDTDIESSARLINVSARMNVTAGEGTLIAGFVIGGDAPKTLLIRGVGPTLSAFGVTNVLADPTLTVYSGRTTTPVGSNDNWGTGTNTAAQISSASAQVGAFALVAGTRDAALLITLQPGSYTVHVTGVSNTTGVALVEIYDTQ